MIPTNFSRNKVQLRTQSKIFHSQPESLDTFVNAYVLQLTAKHQVVYLKTLGSVNSLYNYYNIWKK